MDVRKNVVHILNSLLLMVLWKTPSTLRLKMYIYTANYDL